MRNLLNDQLGTTAAEYAIILAIIGTIIALAAVGLANAVGGAMTHTSECIADSNVC